MPIELSPGFDNEPPVESVLEYVANCLKREEEVLTEPQKIIMRCLWDDNYTYVEISKIASEGGLGRYQARTLRNAYSKLQQLLRKIWDQPKIPKAAFKEMAIQQYRAAQSLQQQPPKLSKAARILIYTGPVGSGKTCLVKAQPQALSIVSDQHQPIYLRATDAVTVENLYDVLQAKVNVDPKEMRDSSLGSTGGYLPPDRPDLWVLKLLRQRRLAVIIDQAEHLLDSESFEIKPDSGYRTLIRTVTETSHDSCLIWVTNIKPMGLSISFNGSVQEESHPGLCYEAAMVFLAQTVSAERETGGNHWLYRQLVTLCHRNPGCLEAVGLAVRNTYRSIQDFVANVWTLPSDLQSYLADLCVPLSEPEWAILYRLAFQSFSLADLQDRSLYLTFSHQDLIHAWEKLCNRHFIDPEAQQITPPLLSMFVVNHLGDCLIKEFDTESPNLFHNYPIASHRHPLDKQPQPYASLLKKIIDHCRWIYVRHPATLTHKIERLLQQLTQFQARVPVPILDQSYAAGNLINLAQALKLNWSDMPWRHLSLYHVNLQNNWQVDLSSHHEASNNFSGLSGLDLQTCFLRIPSLVTGLRGSIHHAAMHPDGSAIVLSDQTGQLQIYQYAESEHRYKLQGFTTLQALPQILKLTLNDQLMLINEQQQLLIATTMTRLESLIPLDTEILFANQASLDPKDSGRVAIAYEDQIKLWDMYTSCPLDTVSDSIDSITDIILSPYEDAIAIRTKYRILICLKPTFPQQAFLSAYTAYELALETSSESWLAHQWTPGGFVVLEALINSMTTDSDISQAMSAPVRLHYFSSKLEDSVEYYLKGQDCIPLSQHIGQARLAAFSRNGEYLAIYSIQNSLAGTHLILQSWQLQIKKQTHLQVLFLDGFTLSEIPKNIAISNDGQRLLCQTHTTVTLWDLARRQCFQRWDVIHDSYPYHGYQFDPDQGLSNTELDLVKKLGATVHSPK